MTDFEKQVLRNLLFSLASYVARVPDDRLNAEHLDREEMIRQTCLVLRIKPEQLS
jgi:hypothetical protein